MCFCTCRFLFLPSESTLHCNVVCFFSVLPASHSPYGRPFCGTSSLILCESVCLCLLSCYLLCVFAFGSCCPFIPQHSGVRGLVLFTFAQPFQNWYHWLSTRVGWIFQFVWLSLHILCKLYGLLACVLENCVYFVSICVAGVSFIYGLTIYQCKILHYYRLRVLLMYQARAFSKFSVFCSVCLCLCVSLVWVCLGVVLCCHVLWFSLFFSFVFKKLLKL